MNGKKESHEHYESLRHHADMLRREGRQSELDSLMQEVTINAFSSPITNNKFTAIERDAARYRYMRNTHTWEFAIWQALDMDSDGDYQIALDMAVDAAIAAAKEKS